MSTNREDHTGHHGYREGRTGGAGGVAEVSWYCQQCGCGGRDQ